MKVVSWNINSAPARASLLTELVTVERPDVVCLSETRCNEAAFDLVVADLEGWEWAHVPGDKGRNGVAIGSRVGLTDVVMQPVEHHAGLADTHTFGVEARSVVATCGPLRVISVYTPNGRELDHPHYAYKLAWYRALREVIASEHAAHPHVVAAGDVNVAPADLDVWSPKQWRGRTHVSAPEREAFAAAIGDGGLLRDVYRTRFPDDPGYTWWNYRSQCYDKNQGLRIDVIGAVPALEVAATEVCRWARSADKPSDHAPLSATFSFN